MFACYGDAGNRAALESRDRTGGADLGTGGPRAAELPAAKLRTRLIDELGFLPLRALRAVLRDMEPDRAVAIGAAVGRSTARLGGSLCETARINLAIAFPHWPEAERERVLIESYANLGRGVAELALLQGPRREELLDRVSVEGLEHVAAAEAASPSGGVIMLTAHFGSWDLCGAAMASRGHPLSVVHRGFRNPLVQQMMSRARGAGVGEGALEELEMKRSAAAGVLRALREGRKLALLLDQNAHRDEGVFVPFFSRLACTRSAPALIAMRRGIPVLPAFVFREGDRARHSLRILPPLELEPPGRDADQALRRNVASMTRVIESAIEQAPTHWLWPHRRWRTRPTADQAAEESAPVYPRRRGALRRARHALRRARS